MAMDTDGNEVVTLRRVVMSLKADGTALVTKGVVTHTVDFRRLHGVELFFNEMIDVDRLIRRGELYVRPSLGSPDFEGRRQASPLPEKPIFTFSQFIVECSQKFFFIVYHLFIPFLY